MSQNLNNEEQDVRF